MQPNNFKWNQATIEGDTTMHNGIVMLLAFKQNRSPMPIGTGFIIGAYEDSAIGITASHNFEGISEIQASPKKHHVTALAEFLPDAHILDIDRKKVRAICFKNNGEIEIAVIVWAAYDKNSDIAVFSLIPQDKKSKSFFQSAFQLDEYSPKIGDEVALLGLSQMAVLSEERDGNGKESFQLSKKLILRRGTITNVHEEGHILCKGPCVETSIPVFSGMSGGPVMILGKSGEPMKPFGLISSDLEKDEKIKNTRSISGTSIVARINPIIKFDADGERKSILKINASFLVNNKNEPMYKQSRKTLETSWQVMNSGGGVLNRDTDQFVYDRYMAIGTSYKIFGKNFICATCSIFLDHHFRKSGKVKMEDQIKTVVFPRLVFFAKPDTKPERYGWMKVLSGLLRADFYNEGCSYGIIVDSDLYDLQKINEREQSIIDDFFAPDNVSLLYSTPDSDINNLPNKLIAEAVRVATESLDCALNLVEGQESFDFQKKYWDITTLNDVVNNIVL